MQGENIIPLLLIKKFCGHHGQRLDDEIPAVHQRFPDEYPQAGKIFRGFHYLLIFGAGKNVQWLDDRPAVTVRFGLFDQSLNLRNIHDDIYG